MKSLETQAAVGMLLGALLLGACSDAGVEAGTADEPTDAQESGNAVRSEDDAGVAAGEARVAYTLPELMRPSLTATADRVNAEGSGLTINLVELGESCSDMPIKIQADIATGNAPDLANVCFNGLRQFIDSGRAQPIDDLIEADASFDLSNFARGALEAFRHDGRLYGLPNASSTAVVFYNADLFREAGLDPDSPPASWEDMADAARMIDDEEAGIEGLTLAMFPDNFIFEDLFLKAGGAWTNDDESDVTFDQAAGQEALNYIVDLANEGVLAASPDFAQQHDLFARGEAGMIASSSARLGQLEEQSNFDLRVMAFPPPEGMPEVSVGQGLGYLVFAEDPDQRRVAYEALKALTAPTAATEVATTTGFLSPNIEANQDPDLLGDILQEDPNRAVLADVIPQTAPVYEWPGTRQSEIQSVIRDELLLAVGGSKEPGQALADAAAEVAELMQR